MPPDDPGRSLFAAICQPALRYGPGGRVEEATGPALAIAGGPLAGCSPAEVAARVRARWPDGAPVAPDDLPGARALGGERVVDLPLALTAPDGRRLEVRVSASPIRDGGGTAGALVVWHPVPGGDRPDLVESEAKYRNLVELSPDAILIHRDGVIVFANPAAAALLDLPGPEEVVGRPILGIVAPAARDDVASNIALDLVGEESPLTRVEILRDDGSTVTAQGRGALIPYGGRPAVQVVLRDVTDLTAVQAALRASEERLRLALESAEIGIWDRDIATDTVTISPEFLRRYGLGSGAVTDYAAWEGMIHPDDRARVEAGRRAAVAGGHLDLEFRVRLPSGDGLWIGFRGRVVADGHGDPSRVIGVLIDLTARKRAEAALEGVNRILSAALTSESETALGEVCLEVARAITQSPYGFIGEADGEGFHDIAISSPGWDACAPLAPDGHRRLPGRFALRGLFGRVVLTGRSLVANDPAGHPDAAGVPPGHPPLAAFLGVPLVREAGTFGLLAVANRPGGYGEAERELLEAVAPAVVEAFARKRAEQALRRYTERLRRSNEELQRFAYVASHDLQEPLRSIVSFSQLLERRYGGQLGTDADEFIAFIVEGGNRMQRLIEDLLQLSRVETRAQPAVRVDAGTAAADAVSSLERPVREAGATVEVGPLPAVMADPAQLVQVFANLVSNAVKYRREGVPPAIAISAERLDGMVEFAVADNGIGIEAEYFDRIFEMFQRLHTRAEYEGTGIGLAVVKKVVERHGGTVRVESRPGEGSTFYFTLPAA